MEVEQKRAIFLGGIIVLVIVGAIGYFFWGNLVNKGTIKIYGPAPFKVEFFNLTKGEVECNKSPCEIEKKAGIKNMLVTKDGYESVITGADLGLWKTVEVRVDMKILPKIEEVKEMPEGIARPKYELVYDERARMQKIVKVGDKMKTAIAYFPKELKNPKIFGGEEGVFVMEVDEFEQTAYKINLNDKKRENVPDWNFRNIKDGYFSGDGKYFLFEPIDSDSLWIVDEKNVVRDLEIKSNIYQVAWGRNDMLVFVTGQTYEQGSGVDEGGRTYISLTNETAEANFLFGIYDANKNMYAKMTDFAGTKGFPENLAVSRAGEIYFKIGEKFFRIILEKF